MNIEQANSLLEDQGASCLIFKDQQLIYSSKSIGVKPLIQFINDNPAIKNVDKLTLVDKVIGKAAMLLAAYIGVSEVFTPVMSQEAIRVAELYNINYSALKMVPFIKNRQGNGKCPLELSVENTEDLQKALINIRQAITELMKNKQN
ncbi:MAG: DUF1893 domain-containing protein [Clostridiaceae bacterium]